MEDELTIDTIEQAFSAPDWSKKTLKNAKNQFTVKYNESVWKRVPPATYNEDAEFALEGKNNDIWCIIISEETEIGIDNLFKIAKETMRENTGIEPEIIKTELRTVNGTEVLRGTLKANFSGIDLIFDSYYFSNELGSVQFTTYTSVKLWERKQDVILDLLNGFQAID